VSDSTLMDMLALGCGAYVVARTVYAWRTGAGGFSLGVRPRRDAPLAPGSFRDRWIGLAAAAALGLGLCALGVVGLWSHLTR